MRSLNQCGSRTCVLMPWMLLLLLWLPLASAFTANDVGATRNGSRNLFGIGLVSEGDVSKLDLVKGLVGDRGWVSSM